MHNHLNRKRADLCRIRIISAADSLALRECSASELEAAEELVWQLRAARWDHSVQVLLRFVGCLDTHLEWMAVSTTLNAMRTRFQGHLDDRC